MIEYDHIKLSLVIVVSVMLRVMGVMGMMYVRVEAVVLVSRVRHLSDTAVRFDQAVLAVDDVAFSVFRLVFAIACVWVFHPVLVRVMGWRLILITVKIITFG